MCPVESTDTHLQRICTFFSYTAAIEPIIGHLKKDHRAIINYLKGTTGDQINFMIAASGFNYKKLMKKLKVIAFWLYSKVGTFTSFIEHMFRLSICNQTSALKGTF